MSTPLAGSNASVATDPVWPTKCSASSRVCQFQMRTVLSLPPVAIRFAPQTVIDNTLAVRQLISSSRSPVVVLQIEIRGVASKHACNRPVPTKVPLPFLLPHDADTRGDCVHLVAGDPKLQQELLAVGGRFGLKEECEGVRVRGVLEHRSKVGRDLPPQPVLPSRPCEIMEEHGCCRRRVF